MTPTKFINNNGDELWKLPDGSWHCEDGPAVTWGSYHGEERLGWWLEDRPYDFNRYCSILKSEYGKTDEDIMLLRMRYAC